MRQIPLFAADDSVATLLDGDARRDAIEKITANHYARSVPSGKTHYVGYKTAIIAWTIPANKNIARFLFADAGRAFSVWELGRLWAPDGHPRNLLTAAISRAVEIIRRVERPDALVSYADPNVGHSGGVYRAASWIFCGQCDEGRAYRDAAGNVIARRAFHSGKRSWTAEEIAARGYVKLRLPGKLRFVRVLSKQARQQFRLREY